MKRANKIRFPIDARSSVPPADQLRQALTEQIAEGKLGIGDKVPSIRELAIETGVTQALIRKMFETLTAQGWLEVRQGSGTYVAQTAEILISQSGKAKETVLPGKTAAASEQAATKQAASERAASEQAAAEQAAAEQAASEQAATKQAATKQASSEQDASKQAVSERAASEQAAAQASADQAASPALSEPTFLEMQQQAPLKEHVDAGRWATDVTDAFCHATVYGVHTGRRDLDLAASMPEQRTVSDARWEAALKNWIDDCGRSSLQVTEPAGLIELREQIANWLRLSRGMTCSAQDVIIVNGAQEGRDLAARLLIDRGRTVVFEEPGSVLHRVFLQAHGAKLMPVHVDDSGIIIDELERVQEQSVLYVCPSSHFPTGAVLSKARRGRILDWAHATNSIIIEDDINCEFTYESRVTSSLHSSDTADRTIYIGSLSHIIPSSWRVGFIVVPRAIRPTMMRLKSLANRCTAFVVQSLVLRLFESGFMQEQVRKLQRVLEARRKVLLDELHSWPPQLISYTPVKSGLLQTLWLPTEIDDVATYHACMSKGTGVIPVSPCFMAQPARPGLIVNFGAMASEQLLADLSVLRAVLTRR